MCRGGTPENRQVFRAKLARPFLILDREDRLYRVLVIGSIRYRVTNGGEVCVYTG